MAAPSNGILHMTSKTEDRAETRTGDRAGTDNRVAVRTGGAKQLGRVGKESDEWEAESLVEGELKGGQSFFKHTSR